MPPHQLLLYLYDHGRKSQISGTALLLYLELVLLVIMEYCYAKAFALPRNEERRWAQSNHHLLKQRPPNSDSDYI